jgi:hypothetical protein
MKPSGDFGTSKKQTSFDVKLLAVMYSIIDNTNIVDCLEQLLFELHNVVQRYLLLLMKSKIFNYRFNATDSNRTFS